MTTTTATTTYNKLPSFPVGLLVIALLATGILYGAHAVEKHGAEATQIAQCLEKNGPTNIYRLTSPKRHNQFILTCQLEDGRWGLAIVEKTWRGLVDRTRFVPRGDGSLARLWEYISAKGVELIGAIP